VTRTGVSSWLNSGLTLLTIYGKLQLVDRPTSKNWQLV
jgi:hypothetical protein